MTRRRAPIRTLLALVALALATGACGDDGDDASSTPTTDGPTTTDAPTTTGEKPTTTAEPAPAEDPPVTDPDDPGEADDSGDPLILAADLTGDTEVPGPGDPAATGRIEIESIEAGDWCIDMEAMGLTGDVSDAHIHFGPTGNSGDVVIPIGEPTSTAGDTDTWTDVCVTVDDDLVAEVVDAPDAFYANVHTTEFPKGAIRGQLALSSIFDLTLR